jgi:hypothetical protein
MAQLARKLESPLCHMPFAAVLCAKHNTSRSPEPTAGSPGVFMSISMLRQSKPNTAVKTMLKPAKAICCGYKV